jgi:hypothetical protein
MTTTIRWFPQAANKGGDMVADAFLKILTQGDSKVSEPELLVRETAQNSWDARRVELGESTRMKFRIVSLDGNSKVRTGVERFFADAEPFAQGRTTEEGLEVLRELWNSITSSNSSLLYVQDEGTHGLGGPTDAQTVVPNGIVDRYVRFLLNIGQANDHSGAGGSYGMGRSVFWRASSCQTVVVYSRFIQEGEMRSRIVGLSIGKKFSREKNHTGRHWWSTQPDGEPVEGPEADELALELGFEVYDGSRTGTTVMVVAPRVPKGTRDLAEALARSIELHLWPKYSISDERPAGESMIFEVKESDETVEVRSAARLAYTPLGSFITAFKVSRNAQDSRENPYSSELRHPFRAPLKRVEKLGRLTIVKSAKNGMIPIGAAESIIGEVDDDGDGLAAAVEHRIANLENTIALMRTPELVVGYVGVPYSDDSFALSGVFKASENANEWFRKSESATHTEWSSKVPTGDADGRHTKRVVNAFDDRLKLQFDAWFPKSSPVSEGGRLDVGEFAGRFGRLLDRLIAGRGARDVHRPDDGDTPPPSKKKKKGSVEFVGNPEIDEVDGELANRWTFTVDYPGAVVVNLEVKRRLDTNSTEKVDAAPGGRPAINMVSVDGAKKFRHDPTKSNEVLWSTELDVEGDSVAISSEFIVEVLYEPGTTPILDVTLSEPSASVESTDSKQGEVSR